MIWVKRGEGGGVVYGVGRSGGCGAVGDMRVRRVKRWMDVSIAIGRCTSSYFVFCDLCGWVGRRPIAGRRLATAEV